MNSVESRTMADLMLEMLEYKKDASSHILKDEYTKMIGNEVIRLSFDLLNESVDMKRQEIGKMGRLTTITTSLSFTSEELVAIKQKLSEISNLGMLEKIINLKREFTNSIAERV